MEIDRYSQHKHLEKNKQFYLRDGIGPGGDGQVEMGENLAELQVNALKQMTVKDSVINISIVTINFVAIFVVTKTNNRSTVPSVERTSQTRTHLQSTSKLFITTANLFYVTNLVTSPSHQSKT